MAEKKELQGVEFKPLDICEGMLEIAKIAARVARQQTAREIIDFIEEKFNLAYPNREALDELKTRYPEGK